MKLSEYPGAIAAAEMESVEARGRVRGCQARLSAALAKIEEMVSFDKTLSNEEKRRSMRLVLSQEEAHIEVMEALGRAQDAAAIAQIAVDRLIREFEVAKLLGIQGAPGQKAKAG
jgi:hypothetical protein